MKEKKGYYGYVKKERIKRLVTTVILFAIPLLLFVTGYMATKTTKNLFTVIAVVGCLPGCKALVGTIMIFLVKPMKEKNYKAIKAHAGKVLVGYELYITSYEHSEFVCAAAVHGSQIVCYSDRLKNPPELLEEHISKLMDQNGYHQKVKVFTRLEQFTDRLDTMNAHFEELDKTAFTPDPRYPDYDRNQMVMHLLYRLAL